MEEPSCAVEVTLGHLSKSQKGRAVSRAHIHEKVGLAGSNLLPAHGFHVGVADLEPQQLLRIQLFPASCQALLQLRQCPSRAALICSVTGCSPCCCLLTLPAIRRWTVLGRLAGCSCLPGCSSCHSAIDLRRGLRRLLSCAGRGGLPIKQAGRVGNVVATCHAALVLDHAHQRILCAPSIRTLQAQQPSLSALDCASLDLSHQTPHPEPAS